MNEPTQEQIKKFWEWCGFKPITFAQEYKGISYSHPDSIVKWLYPNGGKSVFSPDIDLNNLFKYAVPKLAENESLHLSKYTRSNGDYTARIGMYPEVISDKPEIALFWAIYKAVVLNP